ncbi:MAG: metallophosphoesterase [Alphaproteobacteria bacterium]|nr:metallophosphoesterase [Alphaproteobacteria bacterium]
MSENAFPQDQVYRIPAGTRVYAIGDVHGCLEQLHKMHEVISFDLINSPPQAVHIVYLGDYIDRGPDSRGVIDTLIERQMRGDGIQKTFILGNHELGLFEFLEDPETEIWTEWGGMETLASYGLTFPGGDVITR